MTYIVKFCNPKLAITSSVLTLDDGHYAVTVRDDAAGYIFQAFTRFLRLSDAVDCARSISGIVTNEI
jgi:hypothetical protein